METTKAPPPVKKHRTLPDFVAVSQWVKSIIDARFAAMDTPFAELVGKNPPPALSTDSAIGDFIVTHELTAEAIFVLLFIYEYTINFEIIDKLVGKNNPNFLHPVAGRFAPTAYTLVRLISGNSGTGRQEVLDLFRVNHAFNRRSIIHLGEAQPGLPEHSGVVRFVDGVFEMFSTNRFKPPRFGPNFPAELMTEKVYIDDMILPAYLIEDLKMIVHYPDFEPLMRFNHGFDTQLTKGYRVLLSGPPGTGKTLAASVIGSHMQRDVYRVDISRVTSKYIGETEKNLSRLFDLAEGKGWILFFDEADAIFGNRVEDGKSDDVSAAHRNDMISYLLQRIENYNGIVLAATNMPNNIDVALKRRFQEHLVFPLPGKEMSLTIWNKYLPDQVRLPLDERITPEFLTRDVLPPAAITKICCKMLHRALYNRYDHIPFALIDKLIKDEKRSLGL